MKFTSILKKVILEQSKYAVNLIKNTQPSKDKEGQKVKPKMTVAEYNSLIAADPTTRLNNIDLSTANSKELEKVKSGKYTEWLINRYLMPNTETQPGDSGYEREVKNVKETFMEDLYKVTDDLAKFEKFKGRLPENMRDINKLTPNSLYQAVKDFDLTLATTTKSERKSAEVHPGAKMVFDGPTWRVIEIENQGAVGKEAACYYGGNNQETRWCTSSPGTDRWFNRYITEGPLYVIYKPSDSDVGNISGLPKNRYQFHFPSNQFMNIDDDSQDLVSLLNGPMIELKDFFKPEFAKGLTVGGESLVIDSFSTGAIGKFIGLYGLEDLIGNLPNTLKNFHITNKDNNGLIIEIPEEIGKFKELEYIYLENCINKVPDSICTLPKLRFIALMKNVELREIPECIVDLPNLYFLNLKGSPNVIIPEIIKERGNDMGDGMWDLEGMFD
jgi:Leucine-rich repeat (LRR) protein